MQRMSNKCGYISMIFALANLTLGPLSLTIAENFCGPTLSKTSFILVAKKFPV